MSVTWHYIDEEFEMNSRTLQVKNFVENSHTVAVLLRGFKTCLQSYSHLDPNICVVVSDSGSNMSGELGLRSEFKWIPCADHKIATMLTTILSKTTKTTDDKKSIQG